MADNFLSYIKLALDVYFPTHQEMTRFLTLEALSRARNHEKAAKMLGIDARTLRYRQVSFRPYWNELCDEIADELTLDDVVIN